MQEPALWIITSGLLICLLAALLFGLGRRFKKPCRGRALVLEKKTCEYSQVTMGHYGFLNRSDILVLFEVEGHTTGLFCEETVSHSLEKGDQGELVWKGNRVLAFCPASEKNSGQ